MHPMLFAGEPISKATLETMFEEQTGVFDNSDFWSHIMDPNYPGKSGFHCLNTLVDQTHYKESADISKLFFDFDNDASTSTPGASSSNSRPRSTRNKRAARPQPYTHSRLLSRESGVIPMSGSASAQPSYIPGVSHPQGPPPSSTYGLTPGMSLRFIVLSRTYHMYCTQVLLLTLITVSNNNSTCLVVATRKVLLLALVMVSPLVRLVPFYNSTTD